MFHGIIFNSGRERWIREKAKPMFTPLPKQPSVPDAMSHEGDEEGQPCRRFGCVGTMALLREPCFCSASNHPPCSACENVELWCPECARTFSSGAQ